jgi:hypothetical protein
VRHHAAKVIPANHFRSANDPASAIYIFRMIFSAANLASDSDAESSGVTKLDVFLPRMKVLGGRCGVIAARQCPGRRS